MLFLNEKGNTVLKSKFLRALYHLTCLQKCVGGIGFLYKKRIGIEVPIRFLVRKNTICIIILQEHI